MKSFRPRSGAIQKNNYIGRVQAKARRAKTSADKQNIYQLMSHYYEVEALLGNADSSTMPYSSLENYAYVTGSYTQQFIERTKTYYGL